MENHKYTNSLINETSPYLLQHAHNPVNWNAWSNEVLERAKKENKPLLISIGYSACHWCHVMEHESFENEDVAAIMNEHFICIKIDREERPDIDQIYMSAVQLMTQSGGWPLNAIALPDGRPFWGGTYFPKENWTSALEQIAEIYKNDIQKVREYANRLAEGIEQNSLVAHDNIDSEKIIDQLHNGVQNWRQQFDWDMGGPNRAPKFMMPNNLSFLLQYGTTFKDESVLKHLDNTLTKMAFGGVYDQIGGGFSRYSVDAQWKVPHFEKMLYDNAQLISVYSHAFQYFKNPLYQSVVEESINFVKRELMSEEGFFFSALDADSEGVEGKFYVWTKNDLSALLKDDFELFSDYYNINNIGYWEHDNYILYRTKDDIEFSRKKDISTEDLQQKVVSWKKLLLKERTKRVRPGLDDKSLTSWNAMMSSALLDAWVVFGSDEYKELAINNAELLIEKQLRPNLKLWHSYKKSISKIDGFIEDYSLIIQLTQKLFQCTGETKWLEYSVQLSDFTIEDFWNTEQKAFSYNPQKQEPLITHQYEVFDNVIPAANSIMANNLLTLHQLTGVQKYHDFAMEMQNSRMGAFDGYPSGNSNWGILSLKSSLPSYEVVIIGEDAHKLRDEIANTYLPNATVVFSTKKSDDTLLKGRFVSDKTLIYVCENQSCKLPVETWKEALKLMKRP